jgi:ribosomal protection tetracycline resistance protein
VELKGKGIKFNAKAFGKGHLKRTLDVYINTASKTDKVRSYKGVFPLDESQWSLHMHGTFKADDRSSK